jgi:hypothetical protein
MSENKGIISGIGSMFGGNSTILFFIILFLLIFWGGSGSECSPEC